MQTNNSKRINFKIICYNQRIRCKNMLHCYASPKGESLQWGLLTKMPEGISKNNAAKCEK